MKQKQQLWSESEKQKLQVLVQQNIRNSRVDWIKISQQLQYRSCTQCKFQYRNVLHKELQRVNYKWTQEQLLKFHILAIDYGNKWTYIQQNYFPELKPKQLREAYENTLFMQQQYMQIIQRYEENQILKPKEIQILHQSLNQILFVKQQLQDEDQKVSYLRKLVDNKLQVTQEYFQFLDAEEDKVRQILGLKQLQQ
ncbi:Myb-like_DNA-binding domain-containing protein [Hexamita inflata]|uniref:Myb-like DNA-binding domain-containing protein n=1 Tax=Hexamita inflata TaxID=28002 RepID=A0AA86URW0_9EUKA|nr:Myb-like DNA-binding domain-containing protein [Hexamita inflata]